MKIIAFYNGDYPNGSSPMSFRLHYYLQALQQKGVEVEIVIPSCSDKTKGVFEGVPYSFVKVSILTRFNKNLVRNEFAEICGSLSKNCDILFTTITKNSFLKKIINKVHENGGKLALELNENPYSFKTSRLDFEFSRNYARHYFLNKLLPKIDGIIVISKALDVLVSKYKSKNTVIAKIPILSDNKEYEKSKPYQGIPYILHAGALSESKDGVKAMIQAFALAHKELNGNLKFIFTSKIALPSLLHWINSFIKKNKLQSFIEFKGIIPRQDLDELYSNCALVIVNKPSNKQNDYNFPTKLTEILTREIPLIVSNTGELVNYFEDGINAFVVKGNNIQEIAKKIIFIQRNSKEVKKITKNGKRLALDSFYYMNYADKLFSFFKTINKSQLTSK